jgi:multiple sugar transport system ATP-binding protein
MTMADRIVVIHDGVVEQIGAPLDLYDRPINRFVAGFIGSPAMNFIEGRIAADASSVETPQGDRLAIGAVPSEAAGRAVVYGIRPEHLELAGDGIPADVAVIEPTGSETQVVARHSSGEIVAAFRERHQIRPGERIHLRPRAQAAHLFDAQTGARL